MRMRKLTIGVLASAMLCTSAAAPMAAARPVSGNDSAINAANFDFRQPLSLTVQKRSVNPHDDVLPGQLPPASVEGVEFKLSLIDGIDVTTATGRSEAKEMTVEAARAKGISLLATQKTNAEGKATFGGLKPALYLLEEVVPNDPTVDHRASAPTLVILPLANASGTEFTYDNLVVTKPKAQINPLVPLAVVGAILAVPALFGIANAVIAALPGLAPGVGVPGANGPGSGSSLPWLIPGPQAPGASDQTGEPSSVAHPNQAGQPDQAGQPHHDGEAPGTTGDGHNPSPTGSGYDDSPGYDDSLAMTGADIIKLLIAGGLLILFGAALASRRSSAHRGKNHG